MKKDEIKKKKIEGVIVDNVPTTSVEMFLQPWNLTVLKGELTRSQVNMIIELVGQLQQKIKEAIDKRKEDLFCDDDFGGDGIMYVNIPLSSVTKDACKYKDIDVIADRLSHLQILEDKVEDGVIYKGYVNVFLGVWIPKDEVSYFKYGEKRKGFIQFGFTKKHADKIFKLDRYTKYIKSVAKGSRSLFTSRLYMMLSAYKDFGQWVVSYDELRRIFGFSTYDTKNKKWEVVKYPEYRKFRQRVLQPACEELKMLANDGKTNLFFDYEAIYDKNKSKVHPEKIKFVVHSTGYGQTDEELSEYQQKMIDVEKKCREWFDFRTHDCQQMLQLVTIDNVAFLLLKMEEVKNYLDGHKEKIKNRCSYAMTALRNMLMELVPVAEEVKETPLPQKDAQSLPDDFTIPEEILTIWKNAVEQFLSEDGGKASVYTDSGASFLASVGEKLSYKDSCLRVASSRVSWDMLGKEALACLKKILLKNGSINEVVFWDEIDNRQYKAV